MLSIMTPSMDTYTVPAVNLSSHENSGANYLKSASVSQYPGTERLGNNPHPTNGIEQYNNKNSQINPGPFDLNCSTFKGGKKTNKKKKRKFKNSKKLKNKKGGSKNYSVNLKSNILPENQSVNPETKIIDPVFNGGLYSNGQQFDGPCEIFSLQLHKV